MLLYLNFISMAPAANARLTRRSDAEGNFHVSFLYENAFSLRILLYPEGDLNVLRLSPLIV